MTAPKKACPICKKPRDADYTPFCSRGCKDRDLNRWFSGGYAVPGRAASPDEIATDDTYRDS